MKDPKEFRPGRYQHYSGDLYIAHHLVRHHETEEVFVVYTSCKHGTTSIREWDTQFRDSWCDTVEYSTACMGSSPIKAPRFKYLEPAL